MRKILAGLVMLFSVSVYAADVKTLYDMPNLKACSYYDFNNQASGFGAESAILEYKSLDLNVGYVNFANSYSGTCSVSVNLNRLNIGNVSYAWAGIINTDLGIWLGYDFNAKTTTWGVCASLVSISK